MPADHRNIVGGVPERHDYSLGLNCGTFLRAAWAAEIMKARLPAGAQVLELGCGLGWASGVFSALGYKLHCLDASKEAVDEARRRTAGPKFEVADAALFSRPGSYDAVIAFEVLEHLRDRETAVKNWKDALKPGGWLFLSTPNRHFGQDNPLKPENPHHLREFRAGELREMFPGCDLRGINLSVFRSLRWHSRLVRACFFLAASAYSLFEDEASYAIPGRENFSKRETAYHLLGRRLPALSEGLWLAWQKPA